MPSAQMTGSLASSRKRRHLHKKFCGCGADCYSSTLCRRHKRDDGESSGGKAGRDIEGSGQRRSLRIQKSLLNRLHSDDKRDMFSSPDSRKRNTRSNRFKRVARHVQRKRRAGRKPVSKEKDSGSKRADKLTYPENVESWDTRLRHRVRTSGVASRKLLQKEESDYDEDSDSKKPQGISRKRKRRRREFHQEDDNVAKEEECLERSEFLSWARKSKRRKRLHISELEAKNAEEESSPMDADLNLPEANSGNSSHPSYLENVDSENNANMVKENKIDLNQRPEFQKGFASDDEDSLSSSSLNIPASVDGKNPTRKTNSISILMANTAMQNNLQSQCESMDMDDTARTLDETSIQGDEDEQDNFDQERREPLIDCSKQTLTLNIGRNNMGPHILSKRSDDGDSDSNSSNQEKCRDECSGGESAEETNPNKSSDEIEVAENPEGSKHADTHDNTCHEANSLESNSVKNLAGFLNVEDAVCDETTADAARGEKVKGLGLMDGHLNSLPPGSAEGKSSQQEADVKSTGHEEENRNVHEEENRYVHEEENTNLDNNVLSNSGKEINADCSAENEFRPDTDAQHEKRQPLTAHQSLNVSSAAVNNGNKCVRFEMPVVAEGRKCGLCGVGNDGRPPKKLVQDGTDSDNDMYGDLQTTTEDPMYSELDGFGDEPGWLGRLLGPLSDRYGITGVWVHRLCAVWSPEVYFSGVGCLRNVQAALARGRALKCSRCGRPGATIGCRVERCPRTYHLACGRAERCGFDHRKFLMACTDHVHLFRPRGRRYRKEMRKRKFEKMVTDFRKASATAMKKDFEEEEKHLENCGEDEEFLRRERKRFLRDVARISPVYIGGASSKDAVSSEGWDSLAGLDNVVQSLKEAVILPLLYPEFFDTLGINAPRGILLHGYPGTGKTHAVRALIGACSRGERRIAYFARKGADCLGKYVGDAERQLRLLFQVAEECQPSIIFFDEIDGLAPKRSAQLDQTHSSVVSTLLALMDGLKPRGSIVIIGATNRPDDVDPALRRPGRFDREIYFPLPSVRERELILHVHTRKWPNSPSTDVLAKVALRTPGFAGADLQALCTQAAMKALKRQVPLQELLHCAEKQWEIGELPSLPPIQVKESDWAAALAEAPQPCSRRSANMAVSDIVSLPLQAHMVPALLQPLALLVLSLYKDGESFLPPKLSKAAKLIHTTVASKCEEKKLCAKRLQSSFPSLSCCLKYADAIEDAFSSVGLIHDWLEFVPSDYLVLSSSRRTPIYTEESTLMHKENCDKVHGGMKIWEANPKGTGFKLLISGSPNAGQRYLASCILHSFEDHVEIRKLSLPTMAQEGHGDILQGLTHIVDSCRKVGTCVVYMPKIELWALEKVVEHVDCGSKFNQGEQMEKVETISTNINEEKPAVVSQTWNIFNQLVNSVPADTAMIFLATCELPGSSLPMEVKSFFTTKEDNWSMLMVRNRVPCISMELPISFDGKMILERSAKMITSSILRKYVCLIHEKYHANVSISRKCGITFSDDTLSKTISENTVKYSSGNKFSEKVILSVDDPKKHNSENDRGICLGGHKDAITLSDKKLQSWSSKGLRDQEDHLSHLPQAPLPLGSGKGKTTLQQAISFCGYQLLSCKQFAELCWVTSKFNDGPVAKIDGPWKRWPFNSCVVGGDELQRNPDDNAASDKDKVESLVVRGLVAVGLLALKGVYSTSQEVAVNVRHVLEILVNKIRIKINSGKDSLQYFPLLAQVASLEDIVKSWAYTLRSLETNVNGAVCHVQTVPNSQLTSQPLTENQNCEISSTIATPKCNISSSHDVSNGEGGPSIIGTPMEESIALASVNGHGPSTEAPVEQPIENFGFDNVKCNKVAQFAPSNDSQDISKGSFSAVALEQSMLFLNNSEKRNMEALQQNSNFCRNVANHEFSDGADSDGGYGRVKLSTVESSAMANNIDESVSEMRCLYRCCFECINTLYCFVREFLLSSWKHEGCYSDLENLHNLIGSCTVHLHSTLSSISVLRYDRELGILETSAPLDNRICCCSDICSFQHKEPFREALNGRINAKKISECQCHQTLTRKSTKWKHERDWQFLDSNAIFVFVDNVLTFTTDSFGQERGFNIHCQTEHFCLCSLTHKLSNAIQPDS